MSRAVQLMTVANDGGLVLDEPALATALLAENYKDKPVVVLSAIGRHSSEVMTSLLHRIEANSLGGTPVSTACFPDRGSGPSGVMMWPQLLPVRLPSGEAAGALLLSAWGVLDSCCPSGAAVLSVTALLSSVLVVSVSEHGSGGLQQFGKLTSLASAAAAVDHCSPLQQAVFVVHDWRGAAPAGRQHSFEPLEAWAQKSVVCRDALIAMHAASDWYQRVSLFLELPKGVTAVVSPLHQPEPATTAIDPAALLVSTMAAKTFNSNPLLANDLFQHFTQLVGTSSSCSVSRPDPASLIDVLIELSKQLALRQAERVYRARLNAGWDPVQLDNFKVCHQRAAHEARLAFMTTLKMAYRDSKPGDEDAVLSARFEKIYGQYQELLEQKANKLRIAALSHNQNLRDQCIKHYENRAENEIKKLSLMTVAGLMVLLNQFEQETLDMFDSSKDQFDGAGDEARHELYDKIQSMFRQYFDHMTALLEQMKVDESNIDSVVKKAVTHYVNILTAIHPNKQRALHQTVREGSLALCESSKLLILSTSKSNAHSKVSAQIDAEFKIIINMPPAVAPFSTPTTYSTQRSSYPSMQFEKDDASYGGVSGRHSCHAAYPPTGENSPKKKEHV